MTCYFNIVPDPRRHDNYTSERPIAFPNARLTSISICASACATDPASADAYAAFAASKPLVTAALSISSSFTALGQEMS